MDVQTNTNKALVTWKRADKLMTDIEALYLQLRDLKSDGFCQGKSIKEVMRYDDAIVEAARLIGQARDLATILKPRPSEPAPQQPKELPDQQEGPRYPCDGPDCYCPYEAQGVNACRNYCGLGVDE